MGPDLRLKMVQLRIFFFLLYNGVKTFNINHTLNFDLFPVLSICGMILSPDVVQPQGVKLPVNHAVIRRNSGYPTVFCVAKLGHSVREMKCSLAL